MIFSTRLDDLPFPKFNQMKWYHIIIKGGYLILLNIITVSAIAGSIILIKKRRFFGLIPFIYIAILAGILGYVEQRYLVPAYPFMCILTAYSISILNNIFRKTPLTTLQLNRK